MVLQQVSDTLSHVGTTRALVSLALAVASTFLVSLVTARRRFWLLRARGLAMPPWNPVFGHIFVVSKVVAGLPSGAHSHYLASKLRKRYPELGDTYYLDLWPLSMSFLVTTSPSVTRELVTQSPAKDPSFANFMRPVTGGGDMLSLEGRDWKRWRDVFSPGFQPNHLLTLVPDMVEDVLEFREILRKHAAAGDIFCLEDHTTNLTLDIIGKVVLDENLHNLRASNPMVAALRSQIDWTSFDMSLIALPNPVRSFIHWRNARAMSRELRPMIQRRFRASKPKSRSILDLALQSHQQTTGRAEIPLGFVDAAAAQIKLFLFAGHDTTSATLCYAYHLLSLHPAELAALRAEHNQVLGDISTAPARLAENPNLLHALRFTGAVISEALRLFPPGSLIRAGSSAIELTDPKTGAAYPSEGLNVWSVHHAMQRHPAIWARPDEFVPRRWLAKAEDDLYQADRDAWRPFERGPRACVGRDVALLEMKICLALTARELEVRSCYHEVDSKLAGKPAEVDGERAYQVIIGAGHPRDGMPVRVSFTGRIGS